MFNFIQKDKVTLDTEITRLLSAMKELDPSSDEYAKIAENVKVLCESRGVKHTRALSTDMLLSVGANLLGILLVLNYEKVNVVTSKSMSMIFKGK